MLGTRANGLGLRPRRHEAERLCGVQGCKTRLSIYNPGPSCYAHRPVLPPTARFVKGIREAHRKLCAATVGVAAGEALKVCSREPQHEGEHSWV